MTIDEIFEELYKLLRGSRCATPFLEAKELFQSGKVTESIAEIRKIQEIYKNSRRSTLAAELGDVHPSDREAMQLKRRQEKSSDAIELMTELLELLSIRERRVATQSRAAVSTTTSLPSPSNPTFMEELKKNLKQNDRELEVCKLLKEHFTLAPVEQNFSFDAGKLLLVLTEGAGQVILIDSPAIVDNTLRSTRWIDGTNLLPIPLDKLLRSASRGRVMQLIEGRQRDEPKTSKSIDDEPLVSDTAERDMILDMGAFTQLLDAAQRSGIVPGSGVIIQVRDCEFRLGKYNKALQMMESLYNAFVASEMQRLQRLQREEVDIASGRKKMTQRELQAKRILDNQNNTAIERAKVRFHRVLEGLRGLLPLEITRESESVE